MKKFLTLALTTLSLFAFSAKQNVQNLTITGKVGVYGNEPHTYIAIKDASNTLYRIENAKEYNLDKMQNKTVKIEAIKIGKKIGPGFPATVKLIKFLQ
jgi:hypothetical protein